MISPLGVRGQKVISEKWKSIKRLIWKSREHEANNGEEQIFPLKHAQFWISYDRKLQGKKIKEAQVN